MSKKSKSKLRQSRTKTLTTSFEDFNQPRIPNCPQCSSTKHIIKAGMRKVKEEYVQDYLCKNYNKKFVDRTLKQSSYPTPLILHALTYFNLGHTFAQTQVTMKRKYKAKIPISTLNNWVKRFEDDLTFIRLRKKFDIDPNSAIHTKKFHHQQVYEFKLPEGHPSGA